MVRVLCLVEVKDVLGVVDCFVFEGLEVGPDACLEKVDSELLALSDLNTEPVMS